MQDNQKLRHLNSKTKWILFILGMEFILSAVLLSYNQLSTERSLYLMISVLLFLFMNWVAGLFLIKKYLDQFLIENHGSRINFIETINKIVHEAIEISNTIKDSSKFLAEGSDKQAKELIGATASVNAITVSIENVSENATESAKVAQKSVNIANAGVTVVQNTMSGMEKIREQIQDTAKKIKRLGESSQEIGDTVSLIDDIADQTNILALNAAIQAAMAGEYGRGFAVVADEVQRLAERSSRATKAIDTLVKTIQGDIKQVIIAMEQTSSDVAQGSASAQDAGIALEKIVSVSKHLADLIQNISNGAQQQAGTSNQISKTMNVIQGIASETASNSAVTADSLNLLNQLIQTLMEQVSSFNRSHDR